MKYLIKHSEMDLLDLSKDAVIFQFGFNDLNEVIIQISYCQQILANQIEYIVNTTKAWKKPLRRADFQLMVPDNLEITQFEYKPDDSLKIGNKLIYYWTIYDFMPAKNMMFQFKPAE